MKWTKAVEYNRQQRIQRGLWLRIQRIVGTTQDGVPGPQTARAVAIWQGKNQLPGDGMVGPNTLIAMGLMTSPRNKALRKGLWLDMAPQELLRDVRKTVERLQHMGISAVSVMLTSSKHEESPRFKWVPLQIEQLSRACRAADIEFGVTVWPWPREEHILELVAGLELYMPCCDFLDFDCEHNWRVRHLDGFPDMNHAAQALVVLCREFGVPLHCNALWEGRECSADSTIARRCDVLIPQAYSVYKPAKAKYAWGERYGPGIAQRLAVARASSVQGPALELGLAVYAQKFPGQNTFHAMNLAIKEVKRHNIPRVWYWSAKHVMRKWSQANDVRRFLIGAS